MAARRVSDVDDHVGRRVRERRRKRGMTQTELADALGTSYQQIQKYEGGTNRVSAGRLYVLAQALGVTVGYFFKGTGSPVRPTTEPAGSNDEQRIALINSFTQISSAVSGSAILRFLRAIAAEDAQS